MRTGLVFIEGAVFVRKCNFTHEDTLLQQFQYIFIHPQCKNTAVIRVEVQKVVISTNIAVRS